MDKFLILFSNGLMETWDKVDETTNALLEKGLITFIFDCKENIIKSKNEKGEIKDNKVNHKPKGLFSK